MKKLLPKQYTHQRFPITKAIDFHPYFDINFQPQRDLGAEYGNIEYINAEHTNLPYYRFYRKPFPLTWKSTIVYNDKLGDTTNEAVALDAVSHGLREQDKNYRKLLAKAEDVFKQLDIGENMDEEEVQSIIDSHVRSLLVPDSLASKMNYDKHEIDEYPDNYKEAIQNCVNYIMNYK